jgi:hypothetical protein
LKPGPARRVDPRPGRPGLGISPGLSKNLSGSWPGETRMRPDLFIYIYIHTHAREMTLFLLFLPFTIKRQLVVVLLLGDGEGPCCCCYWICGCIIFIGFEEEGLNSLFKSKPPPPRIFPHFLLLIWITRWSHY